MNPNYLELAKDRISNIPLLINVVSRRVRQLNQGHRPMVKPDSPQMSNMDVALKEIAEGKLWSMFRPITKEGLESGIAMLRKWKLEHPNEPIRNDEMITLLVGRK